MMTISFPITRKQRWPSNDPRKPFTEKGRLPMGERPFLCLGPTQNANHLFVAHEHAGAPKRNTASHRNVDSTEA